MGAAAKVSLIIPVYNVEKYLAKCLESCLTQTLYDVEFLCVNDGSQDNSEKILEQYAKLDPRIQIIKQKNQGLAAARNTGINAASGEWIMFLDSDDFLDPKACERVWTEAQEEPTDIVIFGTNIFPVYPEAGNWYRSVLYTKTQRFYHFEPRILFSVPGAKPFVWRQAFSHKLLQELKLKFHSDARYGEDLIFQMEVFPQAERFAFIEDRLYNYRWRREGSLMSQAGKDLDSKMEEHLHMVAIITEYWAKHNLLDAYGSDFVCWLLDFMFYDLQNRKLKHRIEHIKNLQKIMKQFELEKFYQELNSEYQRKWNILNKGK